MKILKNMLVVTTLLVAAQQVPFHSKDDAINHVPHVPKVKAVVIAVSNVKKRERYFRPPLDGPKVTRKLS